MRTITKNLYERLSAQADEAKTLGMEKLSSHIDHQLTKRENALRDDSEFYSYAHDQVQKDVESACWDAVIRVADYLGANLDIEKAQKIVEAAAQDIFKEVSVSTGVLDGVGAYEPTVPGEKREHIAIELEDSDD